MIFPRHVLIGHGYLDKIEELTKELVFGRRALIITGENTYKVAGLQVAERLEDGGFDVFIKKSGEASISEVEESYKIAMDTGADVVLGIGGGSKIDIAKLVAEKADLRFISVPTAPSHDGIASPRASIRNNGMDLSIDARVPIAIVIDTSIIADCPYRLLASGCGDLLANRVAIKDWELAHKLRAEEISSFASSMSMLAYRTIHDRVDEIKTGLEESAWIVMKSLVVSGVAMSVAGSSRPASGSEHLFAHALARIEPGKALHGELCALGTILMLNLYGDDWECIREVMKKLKLPRSAKELNISEDSCISALVNAHKIRRERYTILGDNGLNRKAAEAVARATHVI